MADTAQKIKKNEAETPEGVERTKTGRVYTPAVDIIEKDDVMQVVADMPGVDEKTVDITLDKNVLTIYGSVDPAVPEEHRLVVSEYGVGDYQRAFTLSDEIDRSKIQAAVNKGVLRLTLPKSEAVKTRKIEVKAES